ncbi:hypothetical protein WDU94_000153 [Cyamophila willieti]
MTTPYKYCCVPQCKSTTIKNPEKTFITLPRDETIRKKWFKAMRRKTALAAKSTGYCCSDHFDMPIDVENYVRWSLMPKTPVLLKKGMLPHKFECQTSRPSTHPVQRPLNTMAIKKGRKYLIKEILEESQHSQQTAEEEEEEEEEEDEPTDETSHLQEEISVLQNLPGPSLTCDKACQAKASFRSKQVQVEPKTKDVMLSPIRCIKEYKDASTSTEVTKLCADDIFSDTSDDLSSLPSDSSSRRTAGTSEYNPKLNLELSSDTLSDKKGFYEDTRKKLLSNPMLFLGVPSNMVFIIQILAKHCQTSEKNIFLCLKKIRWNEPYTILSLDFDLSPTYLGTIFKTICPKMAECLKKFILWPSKEQVFENLPIPFRARFSKVVVIIDCFEIEIEKPSNSLNQTLTWSDYKKCNTLKYLIGYTPDGTVCFVSEGFGGRASDSVILRKSGFLDHVEPNVQIMADRGFKHIEKDLLEVGATLVRPPSTVSGEILSKAEVKLNKQIAALRIHVERVIGRLKYFRFLSPHVCLDNKLIPQADCITTIACALINFQNPIIQ